MDDGLRLSLLSTLLDKVHTLLKLLSFLPLTNLELKIFLEDGSEAVPLQSAALLDHLLPVFRNVGEIDLDSGVEPVLRSHKHVAVLSLKDALGAVLLQLLVEFQADANVDFRTIIFGIGQSTRGGDRLASSYSGQVLPVESSVKICHRHQNTLRLLS